MKHDKNCYYYGAGKNFTSATRSCTCLNTSSTSTPLPTPLIVGEEETRRQKIEKGAKDFAERFENVMKDLSK